MADPLDLEDDNGGIPDQDDDISATLRDEFEKTGDGDDAEDDAGGFDAPLDDDAIAPSNAVEEEEGVKRVQDAKDKASAPSPKEDVKKPDAETKDPDAPKKAEEKPEVKPEDVSKDADKDKPAEKDAPELTDEAYNTAIEALPEGVRARLDADKQAMNDILAPFKGKEAELERMGSTPKDAISRFVQLNDYAQRDPAGYMAWVVNETTGGDADKGKAILEKAAATMGYKIEKADEPGADDDPFMSDKERELTEENRRLRGANTQTAEFGPDSAQERARQDVINVISEVGADNQPVRPHFEKLQPLIMNIIKDEVARTGVPMNSDNLKNAYEQAELAHPDTREAATARLIAVKSAAQGNEDVRKQLEKDAASTARAKEASNKIIDVSGPGAEHQPVSEDAGLGIEDFLRKQMSGS